MLGIILILLLHTILDMLEFFFLVYNQTPEIGIALKENSYNIIYSPKSDRKLL